MFGPVVEALTAGSTGGDEAFTAAPILRDIESLRGEGILAVTTGQGWHRKANPARLSVSRRPGADIP